MLFSSFQQGKYLKVEYTVVLQKLFSNQRFFVLLVLKKASGFETCSIYLAIVSPKFT